MKQTTLSILNDETTLLEERIYDENNNIIYRSDFTVRPSEETNYTYNDENQLIREELVIGGLMCDSHEFEYNEEAVVAEHRHFINGELYEKVVLEPTEFGHQFRTFQEDEEVHRSEHDTKSQIITERYYEYGELYETHSLIKDANSQTSEVITPGGQGSMKRVEISDEFGNLVEQSIYISEELIQYWKCSYTNKLPQLVALQDFQNTTNSYTAHYEYDENGNLISKEKINGQNQLIESEQTRFNDNNQVVETAGIRNAKKYHQRFDYDVEIT